MPMLALLESRQQQPSQCSPTTTHSYVGKGKGKQLYVEEEEDEEEEEGTQEQIQVIEDDDDEELLFASDDARGDNDEAGASDMAAVMQLLQ